VLLALAIFVASGRLVPKLLQRQYPTLSDSFLIASILNTIALFVTDVLTYKLGGMDEYDPTAPEPPISQAIALKKVRFSPGRMEAQHSHVLTRLGHLLGKLFLRHGHLSAKASHSGALLQTHSQHDAMVAQGALHRHWIYNDGYDDDLLLGYILVWSRRIRELVSGGRPLQYVRVQGSVPNRLDNEHHHGPTQ
jgi:hypothetical protein